MIEGVVALPWLQEARIENGTDFLRCEDCLQNNGDDIGLRRSMHCGYIPESQWLGETPALMPADGTPLHTCAGYTTALPDVADIAGQFYHWENGCLDLACPGGASRPLLHGLTIFKSAGEARAAYRAREAAEKAKRGAGTRG